MDKFLDSLTRLSTGFSKNIDHRSLCNEILTEAIKLTNGDRGTIFLRKDNESNERGTLVSLVGTSLTDQQILIKSNEGVVGQCYTQNEVVLINDARAHPHFFPNIDHETGYKTKTIICVPLRLHNVDTFGVIQILNSKKDHFDENDLRVLEILAVFTSFALFKNTTIQSLTTENQVLTHERKNWLKNDTEISTATKNTNLAEIYDKLPQLSLSESNILIEGESGTGKEVLTKLLHLESSRMKGPFVAVNCAAIPESLFESEFFGVAAGAATGISARKGKVELANHGTLFLDEIGEIPLHLQSKLLRVLQDKKITRLGSEEQPHSVDFRLIVATNQDLQKMVKKKLFREDLYYRISVVQLRLPPLRERLEDIPHLCDSIINKFVQSRGWTKKSLAEKSVEKLIKYSWPGNIRELQNKIEGAMIVSGENDTIRPEDITLPASVSLSPQQGIESYMIEDDLELKSAKLKLEKRLIEKALNITNGNKTRAAEKLGITREGLRKAMLR